MGKSTLLGHGFGQKAGLVVFDPVQDIGNARQDPDLFLDNHPPPLILDEVQFVPELVAALKRRVDLDRKPGPGHLAVRFRGTDYALPWDLGCPALNLDSAVDLWQLKF